MASPVQLVEGIRSVEQGSTSNTKEIPKDLEMKDTMEANTKGKMQKEIETAQSNGTVTEKQTNVTVNSTQKPVDRVAEAVNPIRTWTNLIKGNRSATNGMALTYIPPQIVDGQMVVQLEAEEVEPEEESGNVL
ncbi:PREDICTED: uncharacterized protein LOC109206343 isoform X2 [Nicotiana attenuata]|nr:PREDICTED: uncharacterized protein LOC109206343 isoform X2 [Nicotiana attenuata]